MTNFNNADELFARVERAAGALKYPDEVRALITAAHSHPGLIYDIAFRAKFIVRMRAVLQRLAPRDPARMQLQKTFLEESESMKKDLTQLSSSFPSETAVRFKEQFFSPTLESVGSLMNLLHDLSWVQNMKIDSESAGK